MALLERAIAFSAAGSSHSPASRTRTIRSRSEAVSGPHCVFTVPEATLAIPVPDRSAYDHMGNESAAMVVVRAAMTRAEWLKRGKGASRGNQLVVGQVLHGQRQEVRGRTR